MTDTEPFTIGLAGASSIGLSPRWVQYSGASAIACKVAEALADLATMATGDANQRPTLDREFVAYLAGLGRADKLPSYLGELQSIGFLFVFDGGTDPTTGRRQQRRSKRGIPTPDHFEITLEPPADYVGPRNLSEVRAQFLADREVAYQAAVAAGKHPRIGRQTIQRTNIGHLADHPVTPVTGSRGQSEGAVTGSRGQAEFPQVTPVTGSRGQSEGAVTGSRGQAEFPQVTPVTGNRGLSDLIDSSPRRRGEESIEQGTGEAAKPPAPCNGERPSAEVVDLVRRLPWREWSQQTGIQLTVSMADVEQVQAAIQAAMTRDGITRDQAQEVARAAMRDTKSNPVKYVERAFDKKHLPERLRRIQAAPLADDPLPLGPLPETSCGSPAPTKSRGTKARKGEVKDGSESEYVPPKPACDECGAEEGTDAKWRGWETEDGWVWCECRALAVRPT